MKFYTTRITSAQQTRFVTRASARLLLMLFCASGFGTAGYAQEQSAKSRENTANPDNHISGTADENIAGSVLFTNPTAEPHRFFTFTFQNDVFLNRDFGYTNGSGLTFGKGPFLDFTGNVSPWIDKLSSKLYIRTMPEKIHGIAHMFLQRIQTPEDLTISEPQPDDLPYAGLLALQSTFYAYDRNQSDQFSTYLGWVGPAALADETQSFIHSIIGSEDPEGWDNQIENEIVFKLEAIRAQKLYKNYDDDGHGIDLLGLGQLGIGTLSSEALAGFALRWGSSMEYSHATFSLQPDRQVNSLTLSPTNNFFTYIGVLGGYVANDVLIDGNTFRDSPSVPLRHGYEQVSAGIVFKYGDLSYVMQVTSTNSRTTLTDERAEFGAFSVTFNLK